VIRVLCQQLAPVLGDAEANRALSLGAIRDGVRAGADVVVLPELVTSGYMFQSADEAAALALTPDDELFAAWAAEAERGGALVIGGFPERGGDGRVYNSAVLLDGTGVLGVYRKCHLWEREKLWFTPGAEPPRVFDTRHGRIGVLVCYDLEFPEMTRLLGLAGAELIAVPTNWPRVPRPAGEHWPEVGIAMAAARVNRVYIACCDRAGRERGQEWNQGTSIISPDGWILDAQPDLGSAGAEVDLRLTHEKAYTGLADAFGDRRPELYGAVSSPSGVSPTV